jgi:hypothetical protein
MIGVADSGALFLVDDLAIEVDRHPCEFGDHQLDLPNAPALLLGLESLETNERVSGFHSYALHTKWPGGIRRREPVRHETRRGWRRKVAPFLRGRRIRRERALFSSARSNRGVDFANKAT